MNIYIKNAYCLMIKSGFYTNTIDDALMNLLIVVLKSKNYGTINDLGIVAEDFYKLIGFKIDVFTIETLMLKAAKEGLLTINKGTYTPNYSALVTRSIQTEVNKKDRDLKNLLNSFLAFLHNSYPDSGYDLKYAETLIDEFIENQGVLFYKDKSSYLSNPHTDFIFASFLKEPQNEQYCELICEMISGRILTELIIHKDIDTHSAFKNMIVYLDAGIIFSILGVDELRRGEYYKKLLHDMRILGITVKVFKHTVHEVETTIGNSIQWIGSQDYDRGRANKSTIFFNDNNYKKEQVEELLYSISSTLDGNSIEVEDINYPQTIPSTAYSHTDYYDAIKKYYKENSSEIDVEEISNTVYIDAQSFLYIAYKNNFIASTSITQTRHLLLTDNVSLAIVAKKLCKNPRDIPICASDAFFGAMIWKNSPAELAEQSRRALSNFIYQAFLPTDNLSARMREIIEESVEGGDLSEEDAVILKQNKIAASLLVSITEADITKVGKDTQYEIIRRMQKEQRELGAKEAEEKYLPIVEEKVSIINKANQKNHDLQTELFGTNIRRCESEITVVEKDIKECTDKRESINRSVNKKVAFGGTVMGIVFILAIALLLRIPLYFNFSNKINNLITVVSIVLPIALGFFTIVFACFTSKPFVLRDIPIKVKSRMISNKYEQQNCTDIQLEKLNNKLDELKKELEDYKEKQNAHCFSQTN